MTTTDCPPELMSTPVSQQAEVLICVVGTAGSVDRGDFDHRFGWFIIVGSIPKILIVALLGQSVLSAMGGGLMLAIGGGITVVPDMHRVKRTTKNADEFQVSCAGAAPSLSGSTSR